AVSDHKKVITPTLPINISKIKIILPIIVREGVKPIVNPTVPKHEKTSTNIYSIPNPAGIFSVFKRIKVATLAIIIPEEKIKNARRTVSLFKDRFKIFE